MHGKWGLATRLRRPRLKKDATLRPTRSLLGEHFLEHLECLVESRLFAGGEQIKQQTAHPGQSDTGEGGEWNCAAPLRRRF